MSLLSSLKKKAKSAFKPIRSLGVKVDGLVGGAQGWGKLAQVGGVVAQVVPGVGTAAGGALLASGKVLQAKGAADDAKRAQNRALRAASMEQTSVEAALGLPAATTVGAPSVGFLTGSGSTLGGTVLNPSNPGAVGKAVTDGMKSMLVPALAIGGAVLAFLFLGRRR